MRLPLACLAVLLPLGAFADDPQPAARLGIVPDLKTYPQGTPKEALASVVKAIENKKSAYIVAQLSDPALVDQRVKDNGGKAEELLGEAKARLLDDPAALKQLRKLVEEGEWNDNGVEAGVALKDAPERQAFFRKQDGRWYLENRTKNPPPLRDR